MPNVDAAPSPGPEDRVELSVAGGIARLRLIRYPHNGIDLAMTAALHRAVEHCASRSDLRVVLISAEGRHFSVGGDLPALAAAGPGVARILDEMIGTYHRSLALLATLDVPVVAAVQGAVAGGALGLLWASDVVIAAEDLRLTTAFAPLGLSGDGGTSWYLPRLIGLRRSLEVVMANRTIDAAEAVQLGLVTRVVPLEALAAETEAEAATLAAGPTRALGAIRRLYRANQDVGLVDGLAGEQEAIVGLAASADGQEGIAAFATHRRPEFTGR
jgi:2-(1,2-epoxy-1,2-dihydrophenyl)acetyl-CoA isomerase